MKLINFFSHSGTWNVPYITDCYLLKTSEFSKLTEKLGHVLHSGTMESDMNFCANLRNEVDISLQIIEKLYFVFELKVFI